MTREDAIHFGLLRYDADKPCCFGHEPIRYASNKACCECRRLRDALKYERRKAAREAAAKIEAAKLVVWAPVRPEPTPKEAWISCITPPTKAMLMGRR